MSNNEDQSFFKEITRRIRKADGKIIGEDGEFIENRMGKNDREAWVNYAAERYLKKEEIEKIPKKFEIDDEDVMDELLQREIDKMFGE